MEKIPKADCCVSEKEEKYVEDSLPVAVAAPFASAPMLSDDAKYGNSETVHAFPAPYSTPYDPELERRLAEAATRRGRLLAEEEIRAMRQLNRQAEAFVKQEKLNAERAHQNALYQNYQEEVGGTTQTSAFVTKEAYGVPLGVTADAAADLFPDSFGKQYDTAAYETAEYEISEYKSVYDS